MSKSIEVNDLNVYYGDFLAVEGVNMTIRAKQVTAFIGPSGCGKSTLLRAFNRMYSLYPEQRAEGQILLEGKNILDPDIDAIALRARRPKAMFSNTFRCGKSVTRWKTMFTGRLCAGVAVTSRSSSRMAPLSGNSKPPIIRRSVVLPQPLGPRTQTNSPSSTSKDRSSSA